MGVIGDFRERGRVFTYVESGYHIVPNKRPGRLQNWNEKLSFCKRSFFMVTFKKIKFPLNWEELYTKQWNIPLKFKKGMENARNIRKNHWKRLFFSKNPYRERNKKRLGKAEKGGGRLLGEGRILGTIRYDQIRPLVWM